MSKSSKKKSTKKVATRKKRLPLPVSRRVVPSRRWRSRFVDVGIREDDNGAVS